MLVGCCSLNDKVNLDSSSVKSPGSPGRFGSSTSRQPHLEGSASLWIYSLDFDPLIHSDLEVFLQLHSFS